MARPLRVEYPGAIYHITSRGNAQAEIYLDDADRQLFLDTLADVTHRFGWRCYAYCLMGNHYHLVIETPEPNLTLGMRQLNGVYSQRFNRSHHRVGHLFQGRYKAILVDREAYLLELCRYVVLNPVRAGMVADVRHWGWSSYRMTVGVKKAPSWLSVDWLLSQFGTERWRSVERYVRFVEEGLSLGRIWDALNQQVYLGDDDFVERIKSGFSARNDFTEVPKAQWKSVSKRLDAYADGYDDRREAMARAYLEGGHRMNAIAKHFGVHYSTVSRAVKRTEQKVRDCKT
ncbi:MAG: transposase [Mariprofundales bacterium]